MLSCATAWPSVAAAQVIQQYFPSGASGYDQELGVTVLSRLHPLYEAPGIRLGSFVVRPELDQSLFYNTNVDGVPKSTSWGTSTAGSVSASSDWTRNSLNASAGFASNQFFSLPRENYTDWNVGVAGGYTIGDSQLSAAYSHQAFNQLGTTIGTIRSQTPTLDQTDTADLNYTFNFGALAVTPDVNVSAYRFGMSTVLGQPLNQQFLDRNVLAGGVAGRYSLSDVGDLLVVARGVSSDFLHPLPGQPSNNSNSVQLLAGIDYQVRSVWRYRLLAGVESRAFQADQYATRTAPIVEGSVIWTPTGLTTVTSTVLREIEDPASAGTNGAVFTSGRVVLDHEYMRNVFLQARAGATYVQYLQNGGGNQTNYTAGGGVTLLLNRNVRVGFNYDFTQQTGVNNSATTLDIATLTTAPFTQHRALLTVYFAL